VNAKWFYLRLYSVAHRFFTRSPTQYNYASQFVVVTVWNISCLYVNYEQGIHVYVRFAFARCYRFSRGHKQSKNQHVIV